MISHTLALLALRAPLLSVTVATTGSTTLAATTTGYTRSSGSFVTDGFRPGMELVPTGFTQTAVGVITEVSALAMTIDGGRSAQTSGAGRTLTVGLPSLIGWNNRAITPIAGRPFLEEDFVPAGAQLKTLVKSGQVDYDGLYVLRWYGLADTGPEAIAACADAVLAAYPPGYAVTLSNGDPLRIRTDVAPYRGAIQPGEPGWAVCTLTIPYRVSTLNPA